MEINKIFSLIIIAVFYAAYFIKAFALSLHGIKVNQMGCGKKNNSTKTIELLLKFGTILLAPVQLCAVFSILPLQLKASATLQYVGLSISAVGTICFIVAMLTMGKNWRAGIAQNDSTHFVHRGIYRISRNPAFLGFDLFYLGTLLVSPGIIHIAAVCFVITMFHLQILEEEKFLESTFGNEYRQYKQKIGRYFLFF